MRKMCMANRQLCRGTLTRKATSPRPSGESWKPGSQQPVRGSEPKLRTRGRLATIHAHFAETIPARTVSLQ